MTLPSQHYAALADNAYKDRATGWRRPDSTEGVEFDGVNYRVLHHVNNKATGYQGTIYQREGTGEIIVAHRGTEFDNELYRDALRADGAMVFNRTNPQAQDAIALTRHAMQYARNVEQRTGVAPEVTVTGHSLGGALAQISAHHFGLKGETFNAYGAVSLGYRIPEGGTAMTNHVMAADFVSAASGHYGQVRVYATAQEIDRLRLCGFSNSRLNGLMPDTAAGAAMQSIDSHKMHNFLDVDANGHRDVSVLGDPQARQRAEQNQRMVAEYRDDIRSIRATTTLLSRSPDELIKDAVDGIRGPLQPGEPARREQQPASERRGVMAPRIDDPDHAGFHLYQGAQRGVREQDARMGRTPDAYSDQLAGVLAVEMHAMGGKRIDAVVMSDDAARTFAVQGHPQDPAKLLAGVDTVAAMNTSLEASTRRIDAQLAQQAVQPDAVASQLTESCRAIG